MLFLLIKYLFLVIIDLLSGVLNYPLALIVVLFSKPNKEGKYWLPTWLSWFQTPDNSLNGDDGWRSEHMPYPLESNSFQRWVNQFRWLHRNSMYGFGISILGCPVKPGFKFEIKGDPATSNRPLKEGLVLRKLTNQDGGVFWQLYYVKAWSPTRCIRINLGWKLWGELLVGENRQFVCSPNPLMGYSPV